MLLKERQKNRSDGIREIRRKQLLDGPKARTEYCKLKEEAVDRA